MKLQVTFEFLLVLGVILLLVLPLIYFIYQKNTEVSDDLRVVKLKYAVNNLKSVIESVVSAKGEVKAKVLVPSYSHILVRQDGELWILGGAVDTKEGFDQVTAIIPKSQEILLNNSDSKTDSEYVIRVFYNDSLNSVNLSVFG